jgi:hypothetical protein
MEPQVQEQEYYDEEDDEEEPEKFEKVVVGNGGDNYSIFKMMQEGMIDIEKKKKEPKPRRPKQVIQVLEEPPIVPLHQQVLPHYQPPA